MLALRRCLPLIRHGSTFVVVVAAAVVVLLSGAVPATAADLPDAAPTIRVDSTSCAPAFIEPRPGTVPVDIDVRPHPDHVRAYAAATAPCPPRSTVGTSRAPSRRAILCVYRL